MKKMKGISEERLKELKLNTKGFKLFKLKQKSKVFFWLLFSVLFGYQVILGLDSLIVIGIMFAYLLCTNVSYINGRKKLDAEEYKQLESMAKIPKNRFGN